MFLFIHTIAGHHRAHHYGHGRGIGMHMERNK
jgi:hypothetical protein